MIKLATFKIVKFLTAFIFFAVIITSINSCKKCNDEDPRARILNNGSQKASVQIKTSGGNTVNINNVDAGSASSYSSYAAGQVTFTIKINTIDYEKTVNMSKCFDYDIAIDASNNITSTSKDRNN